MTQRFNLILILVVVVGAVIGGILGDRVLATDNAERQVLERFARLVDVIESNYPDEVDTQEVVFGAIRGMLRTLDPHTNFLDPKTYRVMREEQQGHFSGLGIVVTKKGELLTVISPIEETPAARLGIRAGDVIAEIEGEATSQMSLDTAVSKLKGPKGTQVTITIQRIGSEPFGLTITRDDIPTKSLSHAFFVRPGIGYVRIKSFTQTTEDELTAALDELEEKGLDGLILDLRNNPGGLLDQAVKVSELFLDRGQTVVYTKGRLPESNQSFAASRTGHYGYPLVVLVNRGSASASEIVAGAVQDHDRGLIVGETTWGKGLVQSVYTLKYEAGLALTTAKYYTPSGRSIQRDYSSSFEDYYDYDPEEQPERDPAKMTQTDAGRSVYGGGGIDPDEPVSEPELSDFEQDLSRRDVFFRFGVAYAANHEVKHDFEASDAVLDEFRKFLAEDKIEVDPKAFARDRADLKRLIEERILAAAFDLEEGAKRAVSSDPYVLKAIEVMPEARKLREQATALLVKGAEPASGDGREYATAGAGER